MPLRIGDECRMDNSISLNYKKNAGFNKKRILKLRGEK